jgi:hypothetical protein
MNVARLANNWNGEISAPVKYLKKISGGKKDVISLPVSPFAG